jgi:hypothetical protein
MSDFVPCFLCQEFSDLSAEETEILKAVVHYELFRSADIRQVLKQRAQDVLDRLRRPPDLVPPPEGSGTQNPPST